MKVRNPRTGEFDYAITPASRDDVFALAQRLRSAQPEWAAKGSEGRAAILERFAQAIERHSPAITDALTVDTGRKAVSRIEVEGLPRTIRRWTARGQELIAALDSGDRPSATPGIMLKGRYLPYPLFGAIAPWNFPVVLSHLDAIPALMAGCTALVKPSEITPRFIEPMRAALAEVPELAAVFAYVEGGAETGQAMIEAVDFICFTGSTATGRKVAEAAVRALIPANLELGGKDPMIILETADPEKAAAIALRASIVATGQACQSIERIYVARKISDRFLIELVRLANAVQVNYPDIDKGDIGPFIFADQAVKVAAQLQDAVAKGARILTGGEVETLGGGKYLQPTVLVDVQPDMAVIAEETFGPVLPVTIFDAEEEAIAMANASHYGLSAAVIAGTLEQAEAVGIQIEAGAVSLNDGSLTSMVWDATNSSQKASGLGPSRMGDEGLLRFFRRQALIKQTGKPLALAAYSENGS
ncbi:aldehyde dehydrogenase family protein [Sphingorhabdus contaminans]|uniref:aldehyde dehydrogenase family protein n=1 Tax=Sphingorhabdus contaminans TaxID=1343899 RepID=UPI003D2AA8C1